MGLDLGVRAPSVCVVLDEQGEPVLDGASFGLNIVELEGLERKALEGAPAGTKLHVVMEKTYPTFEYVSRFLIRREYRVSFAKPDQVKAARKVMAPTVKTDRRDAHVAAKLPELDRRRQHQPCYVAPACPTNSSARARPE